jgi:2,3-bisphosphoglycerate-dependent phosphoglycerate mutase
MASCTANSLKTVPSKQPMLIFGDGFVQKPLQKRVVQNEMLRMKDTTNNYFFLLRHAEKDSLGNLSATGHTRAAQLPKIFENIKFDRIFSTDVSRTKATAMTVCEAQNVPLELYKKENQKALIEQLMQKKGQKILIIGHSNTIPTILNVLKKPEKSEFQQLGDNEFNKLFYVRSKAISQSDIEIFEY